jgi:hypothetical protein
MKDKIGRHYFSAVDHDVWNDMNTSGCSNQKAEEQK